MKTKSEALQQAAYKLAEEMYKDAGSQAQQQEQATGGDGDQGGQSEGGSDGDGSGNVEDVDYEVVDDDEGDQ